ncbi:MAG: hypothetical protein EOO38_05535 [Cytophagaceae bacterium]|nr:MAG: hypothetical protein EOO38_05535 [Cytophagaceae bacterium]
MSMLPQGFTSLKYLKQADLTGNEITKLHDNIGLMDSLDVLKIAANPLRERKLLNMSTEELNITPELLAQAKAMAAAAQDDHPEGATIRRQVSL